MIVVMIIVKCNIKVTSKQYIVQPSFSALVVLYTVHVHCSGEILGS